MLRLLVVLALAAPAWGESLTVLDWNLGLLRVAGFDVVPDVAARTLRAPSEVAAEADTAGADVVVLQEVWEDATARAIAGALERLGFSVVRPPSPWWAPGSGLLVAVRQPWQVSSWRFERFQRNQGLESAAGKGLLSVSLTGPSTLTVVATHFGAVDAPDGVVRQTGQAEVFASQTDQLERLLATVTGDVVVAGDFNVGPGYGQLQFSRLAAVGTEAEAAGLVTWDPANPLVRRGAFPREPPAQIDHVFVRGSWQASPPGLIGRDPPLSDHYGLVTVLTR